MINPEHQEYLSRRGVSLDWALAAGFRSVGSNEVLRLLERRRFVGSGFVIPFTPNYNVVRLDFPTDGRKFLYPGNTATRPYLPPQTPDEVWRNAAHPLVVCEGPVKAAALSAAGIPAIGLAGATGGGHDAQLRREAGQLALHPALASINWVGRRVAVMLDSDAATNPTVRIGERLVAGALTNAQAIPYIARVPLFDDHPKLGADDFLMLVGRDAVLAHLAAAQLWVPPEADVKRRFKKTAGWTPRRQADIRRFLGATFARLRRVSSRELHALYVQWCEAEERIAITETLFSRSLRLEPYLRKTRSRGRFFWSRR